MKLLIFREELGRASWKLFHTILARFPEHPTLDEREALKSYIHLFARLYPCGEWYVIITRLVTNLSAEHFQALLASNPPQSSSREAASQWGCHIHNKVNESLNKVETLLYSIYDRKYLIAHLLPRYINADVRRKMKRKEQLKLTVKKKRKRTNPSKPSLIYNLRKMD